MWTTRQAYLNMYSCRVNYRLRHFGGPYIRSTWHSNQSFLLTYMKRLAHVTTSSGTDNIAQHICNISSFWSSETIQQIAVLTMIDKATKSQGYSLSFIAAKSCILMTYYTILERCGLHTTEFKFHSFLFLTSVVKIWHFNKLQEKQEWSRFFYSIFNDSCHAALYFKIYVPFFTGIHFVWFPLLASVFFITLELLQYRILHNDGSYEILIRGGFEGNLLAPVACGSFYVVSRGVDFENSGMDKANSFLVFLLLSILTDLIFGCTHYLTHDIPSLWQRHVIHHKCRKEKLNAFAGFYSDFLDSVIMNISAIVTAVVLVICFGRYHVSYMDVVYAAGTSHLRYGEDQMNLMFFFEWDLIDMLLKKNRIGSYHAQHHHDSNINYSLYGIVSDGLIKAMMPSFATNAKVKGI